MMPKPTACIARRILAFMCRPTATLERVLTVGLTIHKADVIVDGELLFASQSKTVVWEWIFATPSMNG
jgi:hypothetical protein